MESVLSVVEWQSYGHSSKKKITFTCSGFGIFDNHATHGNNHMTVCSEMFQFLAILSSFSIAGYQIRSLSLAELAEVRRTLSLNSNTIIVSTEYCSMNIIHWYQEKVWSFLNLEAVSDSFFISRHSDPVGRHGEKMWPTIKLLLCEFSKVATSFNA